MAARGGAPMSKWNQDALMALQGKLKENLTMTQLCDMLEKPAGGFMNHAEALRVTELSGDSNQIGQIIKILYGKDDRAFTTFCEMLRRSNYGVWANKLESEAETLKNGQGSPGEEQSRVDKLEDKVKVLTVVKMAQGARLTHIDARVERLEQDMQALTLQLPQADTEAGNCDTVKHSPKMDSGNQCRAENLMNATVNSPEPWHEGLEVMELPCCCQEKNEFISKLRQRVEVLQQKIETQSKSMPRHTKSHSQGRKLLSKGSEVCTDRVLELEEKNAQLKRELRSALDEARKFEKMARSKEDELIRMRDMMGSNLHCMPKDEGQWKVDELYLNVQERSTIQQTTIDSIVHTLEDHIQDSVESAEFTEGSPLYVACERYSESYKNWALGYEIILCSVLQFCYETCGAVLTHKVTREAVRAYKDGRSFAPEVVVTMLQNSLAEDDHAMLEDVACILVANGFTIQAQAQQSNSRKYMAVYSLITAYLEITPAQDYIASAKRDLLADKMLKVVIRHSCVEAFVDKVLPLCWQLVTMYLPPILMCDQMVKVNGAHHDLSRMSSRADTVQSYLFPVVWYGGDVHRKARVLAGKL